MNRGAKYFYFILGILISLVSLSQTPNYNDPYNTLGNPSNPNTTPQSQYGPTPADTTEDDTAHVVKEKYGLKHNPYYASLASAVMPGLGQVYNGKLWKVPLFWSILGTLGYYVYSNNTQYQDFRSAYIYLENRDPNSFNVISTDQANAKYDEIKSKYEGFMLPFDTTYNSRASRLMALNRDFSRRNRDWVAVFFILTYIMNIMDASVDAHFANFDVSDKLSMRIEPSFMAKNGVPQIGLNLNLIFSDNRRRKMDYKY